MTLSLPFRMMPLPHPFPLSPLILIQVKVAIYVCATTGNGDAPENAEKFWRFLKRRTQPKTMLENQSYTVLVGR